VFTLTIRDAVSEASPTKSSIRGGVVSRGIAIPLLADIEFRSSATDTAHKRTAATARRNVIGQMNRRMEINARHSRGRYGC
jgi:hypothetical protein